MNTVRELWQEIIEKGQKMNIFLTEVSFNTWLVPLKVYDVSEDTKSLSSFLRRMNRPFRSFCAKYKQLWRW